jgi:glycosyltransferase involved in cell wall biosynthesis
METNLKKTILLLSDDLRSFSGVGTVSNEIVYGTLDKFNWIQLAANPGHPNNHEPVYLQDGIKLYPYNTYGDIFILRKILSENKVDAILHITDPHYFHWLYEVEHEIRQQVPILYYHVWDNVPDPKWNIPYYESCDWIGCISKLTYGIVKRLTDVSCDYVPHGINPNKFYPIENLNSSILDITKYDFILLYNNRNIRRKHTADVILAYKYFCDKLPKEKSDRCLLVMNTQAVDQNGTDLISVCENLCPYNVHLISSGLKTEELNELYNLTDCTINIADNEGFGLTTAESLMAGTPVIVNITGGLQDQCGFDYTAEDYIKIKSLHKTKNLKHGEWSFPIWPNSVNINGSPATPFIFEDRNNVEDVSDKILECYEVGRNGLKIRGMKGREFMINNLSNKIMCDGIADGINKTISNFTKRSRYNLYKII